MDWSQVTALTIPEGNVAQIAVGDTVLWRKSLLPVGYTQLEYLQSDGGQYINLGITPDSITPIAKLGFEPTQNFYNQGRGVFGTAGVNDTRFQIFDNSIGIGTYINARWYANQKYDIELNGEVPYATINGQIITSGFSKANGYASYNLFLFTRNVDNVPDMGIPLKLYYFKLYNGNTLIMDFIPVLDPEGIPCMYDLVSKKPFYNAGTGEFVAGTIILPSDYTLLEYVRSTSKQWFSTGKVLEQTKNYSIEISFSELTNVTHSLFGCQNGNTRTYCTFNGKMYCGTGENRLDYSSKINTIGSFVLRGDWNGFNKNLDVYVNNTKIASGVQSGSFADKELYFLNISGGTGVVPASCKTHSFKITEDGEIIRHYIPCKRNSDNKAGMYDLITKEFKSSMTTTDFIAGTEV